MQMRQDGLELTVVGGGVVSKRMKHHKQPYSAEQLVTRGVMALAQPIDVQGDSPYSYVSVIGVNSAYMAKFLASATVIKERVMGHRTKGLGEDVGRGAAGGGAAFQGAQPERLPELPDWGVWAGVALSEVAKQALMAQNYTPTALLRTLQLDGAEQVRKALAKVDGVGIIHANAIVDALAAHAEGGAALQLPGPAPSHLVQHGQPVG
jgi:hypothetical protein